MVRHELEGSLLLEVEPWGLLALTPDQSAVTVGYSYPPVYNYWLGK